MNQTFYHRIFVLFSLFWIQTIQSAPIALHQLVVVNTAESAIIRLKSYDVYNIETSYLVSTGQISGGLYQLSNIFSSHGYQPVQGTKIVDQTKNVIVSGSDNRVYYSRPKPDAAAYEPSLWDSFQFVVKGRDGSGNLVTSLPGTVTIVPSNGALVGSSFLLNGGDWTISGNKQLSSPVVYEPYTRGALLNHYVTGAEEKINVQGGVDQSLWYFEAPGKYKGNFGIAYGGFLQFTLGSLAGDFSQLTSTNANAVELECALCDGPVGKGITLGFSIAALSATSSGGQFNGNTRRFSIRLAESASGSSQGWRKDPQNSLKTWGLASQCDLIQVLSRLSAVRILGDWTQWHETMALDDVSIVNTKGQLPLCAMQRPDASICQC